MRAMRCPACAEAELVPCADLGAVPALCGVTWAERAEAVASPAGPIRLEYCPACAHVVNVAFRPELLAYDGSYDNSLHHSPTFRAYASDLAKRLSGDYRLAGRSVLELGCGKGDFLRELCQVAGCHGTGYDASYQGPEGTDGAVSFVPGFLPLDGSHPPELRPDFLVTRHVLEHLTDPYEFLVGLRALAGERETHGYFEVPNASYDFATGGWDCIYPHVCYFNAESLRAMVSRAGFEVLRIDTAFSDIFLSVEVVANRASPGPTAEPELQVAADQRGRVASFGERHPQTVARWRMRIGALAAGGANPVLWGAGARGVAFLSAADPDRALAGVVDVNPHKRGRYLPVTGHRVTGPEGVAALDTRAVILTNPAYRTEIGAALAEAGVEAELLVA
ncbi:MAG: methyltransferase domain-containing protein [Micromonosporaceae bacterium]|nr:methyltransferase domain-containing protein [Micromonosporaceae bacterium]